MLGKLKVHTVSHRTVARFTVLDLGPYRVEGAEKSRQVGLLTLFQGTVTSNGTNMNILKFSLPEVCTHAVSSVLMIT